MHEIEIEDVEEALLNAGELAELTGRSKADIVADLLDDGVLNMSAGEDSKIPKDFLDIAQEKAEKLKTLLTTLIPIFALLMGIGAEGMGILNLTEWGADSIWDEGGVEEPQIMWGCMDDAALNYDDQATHDGPDDESCEYDEDPPCVPSWLYDDNSHSEGQNISIVFTFYDDHECETEIDGHFIIEIYSNGAKSDDAFVNVGYFTDSVDVTYNFTDLDAGTYITEISLHEVSCETGACEHADEWTIEQNPSFIIEEEEIEGCTNSTATNYNGDATVDDGSCEYPPPRCDIVLYDILMQYNNTSAVVNYDLDCGDDSEAEGFNVSVQFWAVLSNTTNTTNYTIGFHYIAGDAEDIQELWLHNLTADNYCIKWIAIWTDEEGELFNLIESWSDIEIMG